MAETRPPDPLGTPLAKAPGVSAALAKALEEGFGYHTARDLIEHYPRRYLTRGELTDLAHAKKGAEVTLVGTVRNLAKKSPGATCASSRSGWPTTAAPGSAPGSTSPGTPRS